MSSADDVASAQRSAREGARATAIARKEELAAEAEQIGADSTQWKASGDRLQAILDEWKGIKGVDRKTDDQLWKHYAKARDAFNRRRGAHFAELDREQVGAKVRKEEIIAKAEELSSSTDWAPTAAKFRTCSPSGRLPDVHPETPTMPCGSGSKPLRTCSSPPGIPWPPSGTTSSPPTRRRSWLCSPRPKS